MEQQTITMNNLINKLTDKKVKSLLLDVIKTSISDKLVTKNIDASNGRELTLLFKIDNNINTKEEVDKEISNISNNISTFLDDLALKLFFKDIDNIDITSEDLYINFTLGRTIDLKKKEVKLTILY